MIEETNKDIEAIYQCDEEGFEWIDKKTYDALYEKVERLNKENKLLQDMDKILRNENTNLKLRINKAIKYIEEHRTIVDERNGDLLYWLNDDFDEQKIIGIFKGVDKE